MRAFLYLSHNGEAITCGGLGNIYLSTNINDCVGDEALKILQNPLFIAFVGCGIS
jgi:hypothetical protein